jgi:hypothetical protein
VGFATYRRHKKIKKLKIKIGNVHVIGLYFIIDTNFVGLKLCAFPPSALVPTCVLRLVPSTYVQVRHP